MGLIADAHNQETGLRLEMAHDPIRGIIAVHMWKYRANGRIPILLRTQPCVSVSFLPVFHQTVQAELG